MSRAVATTRAVLETVLSEHPDVLGALTEADAAAWDAVDPDTLDLCRLRMAMLLGHAAEASSEHLDPADIDDLASWPSSPRFTAAQRACLAFTEQFVIDVASLDDDLASAVCDHLGGDGFVSFANALLVMEQRLRLTLAWGRLIPGGRAENATDRIEEVPT